MNPTGGAQAMSPPEFVGKRDKGPVAVMTVIKPGLPSLGPRLALWFRMAGTVAFAGYALALTAGALGWLWPR